MVSRFFLFPITKTSKMTNLIHFSHLHSKKSILLLLYVLFCGVTAHSAQTIYLYPGESYTIQPPLPTSYNGYISNVVIPESTDFLEITKNYDYSVTIKPLTYFVSVTIPMIFIETYEGTYDHRYHTLQINREYDLYIKLPKFIQDEKTVTIKVGESKKLTFKTEPSDLPTPNIEWGTVLGFDMGIKLTNDGVVTGVYETSSAKVVALPYGDQRFMMLWNVNVITIKPETVSLPKTETVKYGETITLQPTFTPSDASAKLAWASSNEDVATVDSNGKVTPKKTGKTTINVKTDNDLSASCEVTVEKGDVTLNCDTESGLYIKGTKVSLKANRSDAEIYYTLDGSTPTSNSTRYTGPIVINENLTLKAIAMGSEYNPSSVVTRAFEVTGLIVQRYTPTNGEVYRNARIFPSVTYNEKISIGQNFSEIQLCGGDSKIEGSCYILGNTLIFLPNDDTIPNVKNGTYSFIIPERSISNSLGDPNQRLEYTFSINYKMSDIVAVHCDPDIIIREDGELMDYKGKNIYNKPSTDIWQICGVESIESIYTLSSLYNSYFVIRKDGSLWSCGDYQANEHGLLGTGTTTSLFPLTKIMDNVKKVQGSIHSGVCFALKNDGTLWGWGNNSDGYLGINKKGDVLSPQKILSNIRDFSTSTWGHTIAVDKNGVLYEWGRERKSNHQVITSPTRRWPSGALSVAEGENASYVLKNNGDLFVWGYGNTTDMGIGEEGSAVHHKEISDTKILTNVMQLFANGNCAVAIKNDGTLWEWGRTPGPERFVRLSPEKILEDVSFVYVDNWNQGGAVKKDGSVHIWKKNNEYFSEYDLIIPFLTSPSPQSVSFCISNLTMNCNEETILLPILEPSNADYLSIRYDSNDENIAIISSRGIITAKHVGTTIITVTVDEKFTATCEVTVIDENDIRINSSSHGTVTSSVTKAKQGETVTLTITPDSGYMLERLNIVDESGNHVAYERNDETVRFVMPASAVTVSATFIETTMAVRTSAVGYATFYDSEWAFSLPNGLSAQVVTAVSNEKLSCQKLSGNTVPKDVAVMLSSGQQRTETFTLTRTESMATYSGTNLLHGSDEATMTTGDGYHYKLTYGLSSDSSLKDVFGWYWGAQNGGAFQIDGHKAWLVVPKSAGVRSFTTDGEANNIIQIEEGVLNNDNYFDLQGRRIDSSLLKKGIYVKNGKKIIKR